MRLCKSPPAYGVTLSDERRNEPTTRAVRAILARSDPGLRVPPTVMNFMSGKAEAIPSGEE